MAKKSYKVSFKTPIGELMWVNISKDGADQSMAKDGSKMQKVATIVLEGEKKEQVLNELQQIWEGFKTELNLKKGTAAKSLGWRAEKDKETDEETGRITLTFKCNAKLPDGRESIVKVLNAKGQEVNLGERAIGNGSQGVIHGEAAYYDANGTKGVTLYLKAIQLTKFVEYQMNVNADDLSEEGSFQGVDDADNVIPF